MRKHIWNSNFDQHVQKLQQQLNDATVVNVIHYCSQNQFNTDSLTNDTDGLIEISTDFLFKLRQSSNDGTLRTFLFSTLVEPEKIPIAKKILIKMGSLINQLAAANKWHLVLLDTPMTPFHLLNMFLTNNKQPQLLYLGFDCLREMNDIYQDNMNYHNDIANSYDDNLSLKRHNDIFTTKSFEQLKNITYIWQKDTAIDTYLKQIKLLDQSITSSQLKQTLHEWFDHAVSRIKHSNESKQSVFDDAMRKSDIDVIESNMTCITYLDLDYVCYLMHNHQQKTTVNPLHKTFKSGNLTAADKQELAPILTYLGQYLTD